MSSDVPIHPLTAKYFPHALVSLRWAALAFALLALICLVPTAWAASGPTFQSGSGTSDDPYLIANADQLSRFRDTVNGGNDYKGKSVALAADIDLAGVEWTPIGAGERSGSGAAAGATPFRGTFDGAGYGIKGLSIATSAAADAAVGLFGIVDGGTVDNLHLDDVALNVPGSELAGAAAGLLIGGGTVSDVTVSGAVSAHAGVGGIVGRMTLFGTIENCVNHATVTAVNGKGNVGGIVGAAYYTTDTAEMVIDGCENTGEVKGTQAVGGIAGLCSAFVSNCRNSGAVDAANYGAGGIVGDQKNYGALHGCANSATITCQAEEGYGCGGIAGWIRYDGAAPAYAASSAVPVTGCDNGGEVHGGNDAGGIVGCLYNAGAVSGCTNGAPALSATTFAAGIVGNLQNAPANTVPSSVAEGITVENNVSATPLDAIAAPLRNEFAYNNAPVDFTVRDNSAAWAAKSGPVRFAVLQRAVDEAGDGEVVSLVGDLAAAPTLSVDDGRTVTLDLAGHDLAFAKAPAFSVDWGTLVVTGAGEVSAPAAGTATGGAKAAGLIAVGGTDAHPASVRLEGGSYSADVAPYVADSYAELVRDQSAADGKFAVLPAAEAEKAARAEVTGNGRTVYYESVPAARAAAAAVPGATVTELPAPATGGADEPQTPSKPSKPAQPTQPAQPSEGGATGGSGSATGSGAGGNATGAAGAAHDGGVPAFLERDLTAALHQAEGSSAGTASGTSGTTHRARTSAALKSAGSVPRTGDPALDAALGLGALAVVAGATAAAARIHLKRKSPRAQG